MRFKYTSLDWLRELFSINICRMEGVVSELTCLGYKDQVHSVAVYTIYEHSKKNTVNKKTGEYIIIKSAEVYLSILINEELHLNRFKILTDKASKI